MPRVAFGSFTLDLDNGDLASAEGPVKLDAQPTKLLTLLVQRAGTTVTREQIESSLWDEGVIVDFDGSIRRCIRKIRAALGDSANEPRFVETQTGRGYRFLCPVKEVDEGQPSGPAATNSRLERAVVVGRGRLAAQLDEAFDSVRRGSGQLCFLSGEAGIGKTTLVEDFLARTTAAGAAVLRGWCSERLGETDAYLPFLDALDGLLKGKDSQVNGRERGLKELAPSWYAQLVMSPATSTTSSQTRMQREIAAFFDACSKPRPLVVFIDDLHWADVPTIDLILYLAGRARTARLMILVTYRSKEKDKPLFYDKLLDLKSRHLCQELELPFLTEEDVADYIRRTFDPHRFPVEFPTLVHRQTAGSPLFMVDLLRYLQDQKLIVSEDEAWCLAVSLPEVRTGLPPSLRSVIERKLGRLDAQELQLLVAASVQGLEFHSAVVSRALGLDSAEVESRLQALDRDHGLIRAVGEMELPDNTSTLVCHFVHVQYQNALESSLTPARRLRLSKAVAEALLGCYADWAYEIASDLAILFEEAHDFQTAAEYFLIAARRAADLFAYTECVRLVRRGLSVIERLPEPVRDAIERSFHEILAPALMATRGFGADELGTTLGRIRDLCRQAEDVDGIQAALFALFSYHGFRGDLRKAGEECQNLWQLTVQTGGRHEFLGHWARAVSFFIVGELETACSYFEKTKGLYRPAIHGSLPHVYAIDSGVGAFAYSSWSSWYAGFPERAAEEITHALTLAKDVAPLSRVIANGFAAHLDQLEHRITECEGRSSQAAALADEYDLLPFAAWSTMHLGWALVQRGQTREGLERLAHGLQTYEGTGSKLMRTTHLALFADACRVAEQPERGRALLSEAFGFVEEGERFHAPELHRLEGELARMLGAVDEADASFLEALSCARKSKSTSLELRAALSRARLLLSLGREREARIELFRDHFFPDDYPTADRMAARELLLQLS